MKKGIFKKTGRIMMYSILGAAILLSGCSMKKSDAANQEKVKVEKPAVKVEAPAVPNGSARVTPIVTAAKKVGPAVVGIATKSIQREQIPDIADFFRGFPGFPGFPGMGDGNRNGNVRERVVEGVGSGVIYDAKKGYVATNNHVVQGAKEITVYLTDGRNVNGKVLGTDAATDLAVVKIDAENLPEAPLGDSSTIQVGEPAIAIGNPLGMELRGSVTVGIVSALNRTVNVGDNKYTLIQTDAAINPGNSGGALVNADGEVMGINSAKYAGSGVEGIGFAIPINTAKPILEGLVKHGTIARPYLGVRIIDEETFIKKNGSDKKNIGIDFHGGIYIDSIMRDSPVHKAGIRPGDIITKFNGSKVSKVQDLISKVSESAVGNTVKLTIIRGDAEIVKEVTLEAVPQDNE